MRTLSGILGYVLVSSGVAILLLAIAAIPQLGADEPAKPTAKWQLPEHPFFDGNVGDQEYHDAMVKYEEYLKQAFVRLNELDQGDEPIKEGSKFDWKRHVRVHNENEDLRKQVGLTPFNPLDYGYTQEGWDAESSYHNTDQELLQRVEYRLKRLLEEAAKAKQPVAPLPRMYRR